MQTGVGTSISLAICSSEPKFIHGEDLHNALTTASASQHFTRRHKKSDCRTHQKYDFIAAQLKLHANASVHALLFPVPLPASLLPISFLHLQHKNSKVRLPYVVMLQFPGARAQVRLLIDRLNAEAGNYTNAGVPATRVPQESNARNSHARLAMHD